MAAVAGSWTVGRSYQAARRRRAELLQAMQRVERAIAAPAAEPAWRERVREQVTALRHQLAEHVVVTEGPDGLYAELLEHAPRLYRPVVRLVAEHGELLAGTDALTRQLAGPTPAVRERAGALLAALSRHRQRGADLVYEAYEADIGGET